MLALESATPGQASWLRSSDSEIYVMFDKLLNLAGTWFSIIKEDHEGINQLVYLGHKYNASTS